ncbi:MAG: hypothetical protein Q9224_007420, partial [Gallowayella concinna]
GTNRSRPLPIGKCRSWYRSREAIPGDYRKVSVRQRSNAVVKILTNFCIFLLDAPLATLGWSEGVSQLREILSPSRDRVKSNDFLQSSRRAGTPGLDSQGHRLRPGLLYLLLSSVSHSQQL